MLQMLIGTNIPFMRYRRAAYLFSGALILATAIWLIVHRGPHYGVDFTGGTLLQLRASRELLADDVRHALDGAGFHGAELQQMTGQNRNEYLVRIKEEGGGDPFDRIAAAVKARHPDVTLERRRTETVGPRV